MATKVDSWNEVMSTTDSYWLTPDKKAVWVHPAGDNAHCVRVPTQFAEDDGRARWDMTENEDGTVTLSPSIFMNAPDGWHGWLRNGEFTTA